jgi:hypothetical protein
MLVPGDVFYSVGNWVYNAARWPWADPEGYNFISGPLADITLIGGAYAILRHHNCHVTGCWRLGRHPVHGTSYVVCQRHHPHGHPTVEDIHRAHAEYQKATKALIAAGTAAEERMAKSHDVPSAEELVGTIGDPGAKSSSDDAAAPASTPG